MFPVLERVISHISSAFLPQISAALQGGTRQRQAAAVAASAAAAGRSQGQLSEHAMNCAVEAGADPKGLGAMPENAETT